MTPISEPGHTAGAGHVTTVPPGASFLDQIARAILAGDLPMPGGRAPDLHELPRLRLYLPTRRAARDMQDALLRAAKGRALLLPRIRAIGEGDEAARLIGGDEAGGGEATLESLQPVIGTLERRLVLTRLIMAWRAGDVAARSHSPAHAAALARELERLMDMLETEGATLQKLSTLVPDVFSEHWQRTLAFLQVFDVHWPAYLAAASVMTPVARRNALLASEALYLQAHPPTAPVIVAGVTGSVPAAAALMRVVAALPLGALVLPGLDLELSDEIASEVELDCPSHPQHRLLRLLRSLGVARHEVRYLAGTEPSGAPLDRLRLIAEAMRPARLTTAWSELRHRMTVAQSAEALRGLTLLEADSAEEEAETVSLILRHAAEVPGRTAALVTPDRTLARRVLVRLKSWGIEIDDSAGRPFAKTVPGAFLDLILEALKTRFRPAALMALLKHPLTRLGTSVAEARRTARHIELLAFRGPYLGEGLDGVRAALERAIPGADSGGLAERRSAAAGRLDADDHRAALAYLDRIGEAFQPFLSLDAREPLALPVFAAAHAFAAEALSRDETGSAHALYEEEAGEAASLLLTALMNEALPHPSLTLGVYPDLYRSLVAGEMVRSRVPAHPCLSIWGPFEARLQRPDVVVLGGLNEGTWPEIAEPDAWLNRPMLAKLELPAPESRIGDSAHDFTTLLGADRVFLTRAAKVDGVPAVPSRWLLRLEAVLASLGTDAAFQPLREVKWLAWARARDEAAVPAISLQAPEPRPPLDARPRRLSVTRIETWLANPYAIFARDILRLEPMPALSSEPDAALRGQVIHAALNRFAVAFPDTLPELPADDLERLALEVLAGYAAHPRIAAFWRPRFRRFAEWFAETEPERRRDIARTFSEVAGELAIAAPGGPFKLTARADRIDAFQDGQVVIADYKSGSVPPKSDVVSGDAPQLPLEAAIALAGGFDGLPVCQVRLLRYIRASGGDPPGETLDIDNSDIAALAGSARSGLERLIARFDDPATPYRAIRRPGYEAVYRYDDYAHLARVKEWSAAGGDA